MKFCLADVVLFAHKMDDLHGTMKVIHFVSKEDNVG